MLIKKHVCYDQLLLRFPLATENEIEEFSDHCAICWDELTGSARKLPCSHLYHQ